MSKPALEPFAAAASPAVSPSRALASAALAGLLCAATPACNSTESDSGTQNVTGPTCCPRGASASGSGGATNTGGNATIGGAASTGGNATAGGASNTGGNATIGGASSTGGGGGAVSGTGGLGSGGSAQSAGGTQSDAAAPSTGDGGSIVPPPADAGAHCRMDGAAPVVTSSTIVTDMTLEKFTAECDARHGVVEIPPHCGGFNTCMGFSYWADTGELTEHTCKGMSSCVGYSCVVCP